MTIELRCINRRLRERATLTTETTFESPVSGCNRLTFISGRRIRSPFEWIKPNQRGERRIVSRFSRDLRMSGSREEERRKLADIINHWNANRLDLFEISQPTEVSPRSRERAQAARSPVCPCREIRSPSARDCYSKETCASSVIYYLFLCLVGSETAKSRRELYYDLSNAFLSQVMVGYAHVGGEVKHK